MKNSLNPFARFEGFCEKLHRETKKTEIDHFFNVWCHENSALVVFNEAWARLRNEEEQLLLLRRLRSILRKRMRRSLISPVLKPGALEKDGRDWKAINEAEQGLAASCYPEAFKKARAAINFTIRKKSK
ncbi:MAG: hypothetical protein WCV72_03185 [Patescibacteria group bacterium]